MTDVKFSDFTAGGDMMVGDLPVGLRTGTPTGNFKFTFPGAGLKDANGNYMVKWASGGASAVNSLVFTNSVAGSPVSITATGSTDIDILITPTGTGAIQLDDLIWPTAPGAPGSFLYTTDGTHLAFTGAAVATAIVGTANQVLANGTSGSSQTGVVTLTTPQSIGTASAVTFGSLSLAAPLPVASGGTGLASYTANRLIYSSGATTIANFPTANSAALVTNSTGDPAMTAAMTDGQIIIGATGGTPAPASLTAGTGITITPGANSISIATAGSSISWNNISGTSQTAAVNNGYVVGNASQTTITLPTTAPLGSIVHIAGKGAGGWILAPGAGQTIQVGSATASASVTSSNQYDSVTVVCVTADTTWITLGGPQTAGFTIV